MHTFYYSLILAWWLAGISMSDGYTQGIGSVDVSFGTAGAQVLGPAGAFAGAGTMCADGAGWCLAGTSPGPGADLRVLGLTASGQVGYGWTLPDSLLGADGWHDLLPLPAGGYLLAGQRDDDVLVLRLDPDGQPDPAFGLGGKVTLDLGGEEAAVKVQCDPQGRIWIAGHSHRAGSRDQVLFVARLLSDGRLDRRFGQGGSRLLRLHGQETCRDAQLDEAGGLIIGADTRPGRFTQFAALRIDERGQLDPNWGQGGYVTLWPGGENAYLQALHLLPGGALLLAGQAKLPARRQGFDLLLYRLDAQGQPDHRMGPHGWRALDLGGNAYLQALTAQPDGNLLLAGTCQYRPYLLRIDAWGRRDLTFGEAGVRYLDHWGGDSRDRVLGLGQDSLGRIYLAGLWDDALHLLRFHGNPVLTGLERLAAPPQAWPQGPAWHWQWTLPHGKVLGVAAMRPLPVRASSDGRQISSGLVAQLGTQQLILAEAGSTLHCYFNGQYAGNRPSLLREARRLALAGK